MHRAWQVITPVILFVAAFLVRILNWTSVYQPDRIVPIDGDAYYHLRRIRYTLDHFPDVLRFDPWMNFPQGAQPIWSPAFDWLIAALLLPIPGIEDPETLERCAVLVPPILGALTVVLVYFLGQRFFSRAVGILAASLLIILPGHSIYSQLGTIDHHVGVSLCATWMLALMLLLFGKGDYVEQANGTRDRIILALIGLTIAGLVILWPGALIHVGVMQLAMVVRLFATTERSPGIRRAQSFALVHAIAAVAVYPFSAGNEWALWGTMNPVVLSNFQPLYFVVAAGCFGVLSVLWKLDRFGSNHTRRLLTAGVVGIAAIVGLFGTIPELTLGATDALSWLSKEDAFQALVGESQPLFSGANGVKRARGFLGDFVFAIPVLIPILAWKLRSRPDHLLLVGWTLCFWLIALLQWRFVNTYSIAQCLIVAVALSTLYEFLEQRFRDRRVLYAALGVATLVLVSAALPAVRYHGEQLSDFSQMLRGKSPPLKGSAIRTRFFEVAAEFLRDHTPSPSTESYSVLAPWSYGHLLKYIAERPVVQDNFGNDVAPENFRRADDYFLATEESRALELIEPTKARYVVVHRLGSGHARSYAADAMYSRLRTLQGTRGRPTAETAGSPSILAALERHRLIYQSNPLQRGAETPFIMIFEIVPGALLVGKAQPGTTIRAQIAVLPAIGERFDYTAVAQTDAKGEYRLRLPYSNERASPNVGTSARYAVHDGRDVKRIAISESAVLLGEQVRGPSFDE